MGVYYMLVRVYTLDRRVFSNVYGIMMRRICINSGVHEASPSRSRGTLRGTLRGTIRREPARDEDADVERAR